MADMPCEQYDQRVRIFGSEVYSILDGGFNK